MLANNFADSQVTVKKEELLNTIKANRTKHQSDYEDAQRGFRERFEQKLIEKVNMLKQGGLPSLMIDLAVPVNHVKEYDRVVRMLEMCVADEVTITEGQFTQYVMDEWNWKGQFASTVQQYSSR